MSKLPYAFLAIPHEFLTEDFLRDPVMMRFIVWMLKRILPHPSMVPLKGKGKQLLLDPFEFMFGRETCALAAGISPKNVYTRLKQLIGLGYLRKVDSKGTSTYSVFVLETKVLRQSSKGQQNEQHLGRQIDQQTGHKLETKNADHRKKKETFSARSPNADRSPFSDKQKADLQGLLAYCQEKDLRISERALRRWIRLYESERITDHLLLLLQDIDGIKKPEAWMETALRANYSQQKSNIKENRFFIEDFARKNNWNDIKITQSYCTHPLSGKDYSFKLPPDDFRAMLIGCYEQHRENWEGNYGNRG
ncbi:MAG: hypothetical protein K2P51_05385 [Rhabdochlamydiaceae bacterium]|nr:hypothetical protein [Rhabdochlamydiaceae bacterium]